MLKGLIKPDLNAREAADRLTAIEQMAEPQRYQAELANAVENDEDASVRLAALAKITDLEMLADLVSKLIDAPASTEAQDRPVPDTLQAALKKQFGSVLQLSDGQQPAAGIKPIMESSPECRHLIACASPDEDDRAAALQKIDDETGLVRVVAEAQHHSTRLAAAERLQQPEQMQACLTKIKNRDKVAARLLQRRLSEHHAGIEKTELYQASIRQITSSMQTLSESVWSPQYAGQFIALEQRWNALDPAPGTAEQQAFRDAAGPASKKVEEQKLQLNQLEACQQTLAGITAATEKLAAASFETLHETATTCRKVADDAPRQWQLASEALTGENALQPAYDTALRKLQGLLKHAEAIANAEAAAANAAEATAVELPQSDTAISTDSAVSAETPTDPVAEPVLNADSSVTDPGTTASGDSAAESAAIEASAPAVSNEKATDQPPADKHKFSPVRRHKVIDAALSDEQFAATMSCVPELHQRLASLSQLLEKDQHRQSQLMEGVAKQLGALSATIAAGKWGTAEGMSNRIARKLEQIEGKERQPLQSRYDTQRKKLDELADWQDFAAKPKLEALVKTMQELPAQSLKPRELADEVKALQQQWKEFGGCRVANQMWPDFKEAGDTAYAPCKEYFDGLKKQREARIKNRKAVCQRLEDFVAENMPAGGRAVAEPSVDEANADSAEVSDEVTAEPVGDWKAMQRMLSDAQREWRNNRINGRKQDKQLEERFNKASEQVEQLIAPHFAAGETERQEIIEKTRKLAGNEINQHVINQAKSLQAAWKVCGPASRKNDRKLWTEFNELCGQIFNKHREEQRAQYKAGMAHVDRGREIVKTIRSLGKKSTEQEDKQFQELQDEFQGLAEFPEKIRKGLLRDFRNACDGYNTKRSNFGKKQERQELDALRQLAKICEQIENGSIDYRDFKEVEAVTKPAAETAEVEAEVEAENFADKNAEAAAHAGESEGGASENTAESSVESANAESASTDAEGWLEQWQELAAMLPKPWLKRINKRRDTALSVMEKQDSPFSEKHNDARRLHCIKLEILRDVETPAEDKALRMQYQLEQLQSGPDSAFKDAGKEQLRAYEVDWLCLPPAATGIAATLEQRFRKALGH